MELNKKIIGDRIKQERTRIELTQEELATKLGLNNKSSISQYEKGDAIPSDDIKMQMCTLFECSLDYLLGKSDIRNPQEIQIDSDKINIGLSKKDYEPLTEEQQKAIEEFAKLVLKENKKEDKEDK